MQFIALLKEKTLCEEHPEEIEPAEYRARKGYDNADYESVNLLFLRPGGPSYADFHNPVNEGDKKQKKLNESVLLVEPSHP